MKAGYGSFVVCRGTKCEGGLRIICCVRGTKCEGGLRIICCVRGDLNVTTTVINNQRNGFLAISRSV